MEVSSTDAFGRLTSQKDCYVIILGSFNNEEFARKDAANLKAKCIVKYGYFYRPDYRSTASEAFFSTFVGPYESIEECKMDMSSYLQTYKYAYGMRISQTLIYLKFRK
jgi:SPOR domain